jgi:hypothetical protein
VSYTPVAAVGSGSITTLGTVQGGVKAFGKTVTVRIDVTVTTAGTAGTSLSFTLPAASISGPEQVLVGREVGSTNKALTGWIQSNSSVAFVNLYDGSFYIADGARYILEGTYEVA